MKMRRSIRKRQAEGIAAAKALNVSPKTFLKWVREDLAEKVHFNAQIALDYGQHFCYNKNVLIRVFAGISRFPSRQFQKYTSIRTRTGRRAWMQCLVRRLFLFSRESLQHVQTATSEMVKDTGLRLTPEQIVKYLQTLVDQAHGRLLETNAGALYRRAKHTDPARQRDLIDPPA